MRGGGPSGVEDQFAALLAEEKTNSDSTTAGTLLEDRGEVAGGVGRGRGGGHNLSQPESVCVTGGWGSFHGHLLTDRVKWGFPTVASALLQVKRGSLFRLDHHHPHRHDQAPTETQAHSLHLPHPFPYPKRRPRTGGVRTAFLRRGCKAPPPPARQTLCTNLTPSPTSGRGRRCPPPFQPTKHRQ